MKTKDDIAAVLAFWFDSVSPSRWFAADAKVDAACHARFGALYRQFATRVPGGWLRGADGCLAAVIVLDQFPRNMFRGTPRAFATDPAAIDIADTAIAKGFDMELEAPRRAFLYMPFQHSEDPGAQARSVQLFTRLGIPETLDFARRHKIIMDRFGRFPHRNEILGRPSSEEERAFLATPGSSF